MRDITHNVRDITHNVRDITPKMCVILCQKVRDITPNLCLLIMHANQWQIQISHSTLSISVNPLYAF